MPTKSSATTRTARRATAHYLTHVVLTRTQLYDLHGVWPPPEPSPTPTPKLCYKNPVQCCKVKADSDTKKGKNILKKIGVPLAKWPTQVEELGYNCTTVHDSYVHEGYW